VRVEVVREPFTGPYQAIDYRFLRTGQEGHGDALCVLPISALLLDPQAGDARSAGESAVSGIAWGGEGGPARVEVAVDRGTWQPAELERHPSEPYAPGQVRASVRLAPGERVVAVRATDHAGATMPEQPTWNVRGYAINSVHRVPVRALPAQ
jgi:hypothetical protein